MLTVLVLLSLSLAATGQGHVQVVDCSFLYESAPFPSCHASTIAELGNGDLMAAYFGGSYEGSPDVCIYTSRKPKGSKVWSAPIMAVDGFISDSLRKACYNPVLQVMPNGELWLFFKIGSCVADWSGWLTKSHDGGLTWTPREPLPDGFLGPIKDKPLIVNDRLICPSSTEKDGWRIHFEILDLKSGRWHKTPSIEGDMALTTMDMGKAGAQPQEIMCIQPSLLTLADGSLKALCRTKNGRLATTTSHDGGEIWSKVELTDLPNNNSGIDAVTLQDGRHVIVYNPVGVAPGEEMGARTPLVIAISSDGDHWSDILTLEDDNLGEYSYPAIIQGQNGNLYCTYTWHRQRIAFWEVDLPEVK